MNKIANLPKGAIVCVDANILAYYFTLADDRTQVAGEFLARGARNEIQIFTSSIVAAELIHRAMISQISTERKIEPRKAVQYLKEHPNVVKTMEENSNLLGLLHNKFGINILPVGYIELHSSRLIRAEYGLMANDSILVAVMQRNKIVHLATNDRDFDRVKEIQVWSP